MSLYVSVRMYAFLGKVQKVPTTPAEALNSSLMGFFEKRKFRSFLIFINQYEADKPATFHKGVQYNSVFFNFLLFPSHRVIPHKICSVLYPILSGQSLDRITCRKLYEDFGLDANTQAFIGHAMALWRDDDYLDMPASATGMHL